MLGSHARLPAVPAMSAMPCYDDDWMMAGSSLVLSGVWRAAEMEVEVLKKPRIGIWQWKLETWLGMWVVDRVLLIELGDWAELGELRPRRGQGFEDGDGMG